MGGTTDVWSEIELDLLREINDFDPVWQDFLAMDENGENIELDNYRWIGESLDPISADGGWRVQVWEYDSWARTAGGLVAPAE